MSEGYKQIAREVPSKFNRSKKIVEPLPPMASMINLAHDAFEKSSPEPFLQRRVGKYSFVKMIDSSPNRLSAVINSNGAPTKY